METRANYALVGLFSLAVLAAAFGFVYWFSGMGGASDRAQVRVVFSGSVTGLGRGSSVLFNGLRVGEVRDIDLDPKDPKSIYAVIDVARTTPVRADTRARIEAQGLAGVVALQLIGGQADAKPLQAQPGQDMPTIVAERSEVQDLLETVRNVARRSEDLFDRLGRLVENNDQAISATVRNVERFSSALGDNAEGIRNLLASLSQAAERIGPMATQIEAFTRDIAAIARQVDMARVNRSLDNVEQFTGALAASSGNVQRTVDQVAALAEKLNRSADSVQPTLQQIEQISRDLGGFVRQIDVARVNRSLENVDRFTSALAANTGDVTRTIQQASEMTGKLNRAADQIEGVLKAAQSFLGTGGGGEGQGAFAEVASAARSIRALADNLDKRTSEITAGINRFTGPGLRDIEALAQDGRRTLGDINRTLRSFERNPQQLLFGSRPAIPDYQGRR